MYLKFYGLNEYPFHVTPDPRFIFWTQQHRDALDHLLFGIHSRKGFIQLTGEVGTGKTTMIRACLAALGEDVETALILNPCLTETQLLRAIVEDFGIEAYGRDRLASVVCLNRFLLDRNRAGKNVVLFIDEAQDLSPDVMEQVRLLSNLETDKTKLLQIVLCGQPELRERLNRPDLRQLRQRITVRYQISILAEADAARYIEHRLTVASGEAGHRVQFKEPAVRTIHRYAEGRPRVMNAVADHALLAGYVAGQTVIDEACVQKAIEQLEGPA